MYHRLHFDILCLICPKETLDPDEYREKISIKALRMREICDGKQAFALTYGGKDLYSPLLVHY